MENQSTFNCLIINICYLEEIFKICRHLNDGSESKLINISYFPFHLNFFNFSNLTMQILIHKIFSSIGKPIIYSNYSKITLLFKSLNKACAFIILVYQDRVEIGDQLLIFQQFSNQKQFKQLVDTIINIKVIWQQFQCCYNKQDPEQINFMNVLAIRFQFYRKTKTNRKFRD
ncbi:unnamed protein product [Paramecium sonneborni]|uniref:Uncharacterized protein n=1 Tax=Paramecium sonneborni TaxID=65129 RepID=A0A8S1RW29_9CILI|nr:unnamed protein product [Paramecium sonneborni]